MGYKMKRLFALVLVLMIAAFLVGCAEKNDRYYAPTSSGQQQQQGQGAYPVGAGCGVAAGPEVGPIDASSALGA